jgi:hypothetical protein
MKYCQRFSMKILVTVILCCTLGLAANSALAQSIWLTPASQTPSPGETIVDVEVWFDFSAEPTLGGGFDITYDTTRLTFVSWNPEAVGDPAFTRAPDISPGLLSGIGAGDFNTGLTGPGLWGRLEFELTNPGTAQVNVMDTASIAGPFVSLVTFTVMTVTYTGAEIIIDEAVPTTDESWGSLKANYR